MLSIEFSEVQETIRLGDLFDAIDFPQQAHQTDESGDSFIPNTWSVEVLSLDGFYPIEGFRWTKPERQLRVFHRTTRIGVLEDCIPYLQCSPEHIVLCKVGSSSVWTKTGDLTRGDLIITRDGIRRVEEVQLIDEVERLCDMQVSIAHSYFADNVLSHNSHFLTMLGANALRNNIDVLHYTFELSETQVGIRYDSNLCEIDSNDVIDKEKDIKEKYAAMKLGHLKIKYFPTNTATIYTIRSHIERLELKGFRPGLIIIDYADIMRSTRQYDSLRHELKLIYEELRGFAGEKQLPIWTASQSNKEGSNSDIVDLGNMSEAYGKAMVADVVLSVSRKAHEKSTGWGRLYIAKNRAGRDGIVYPVKIDTARSQFTITGKEGSLQEATATDERAYKRALLNKWNELKNDPAFSQQPVSSASAVEEGMQDSKE